MTLGCPWPILWQDQFLFIRHLNGKIWKNHFSVAFVLLDMEMKWTASHMNARGQGHFRAVYPWTSIMVIFTNIVSNIFSATSLVQVLGERLQDQWSSGIYGWDNNFRLNPAITLYGIPISAQYKSNQTSTQYFAFHNSVLCFKGGNGIDNGYLVCETPQLLQGVFFFSFFFFFFFVVVVVVVVVFMPILLKLHRYFSHHGLRAYLWFGYNPQINFSHLFRYWVVFFLCYYHLLMSRVMRKPKFCKCENKDADQLHGNREADQRLCFRYLDSTLRLLLKYKNWNL